MQFKRIKLNIRRFDSTLGPIDNSGSGSTSSKNNMKMKIVVNIVDDVGVYVKQLIHYRTDNYATGQTNSTEYINGTQAFYGYVNFAANSSEQTTYNNDPGFLISGTGNKTITITFSSSNSNVSGAVFTTSVNVPSIPTRYVYYNQGNASSTTNLPTTQSAKQGNSLILATNRMTRNSANTQTNTVTFNVDGTNRGTRNCYINTSYSADGWATSASGNRAYTNGQSVTMGNSNITLYPYFTSSNTQVPLTLPSLDDLQVTIPNKTLEGWYTYGYQNKIGNAGDSVFLQNGQVAYAKLLTTSNIKYNSNNTGFTTKNAYLSVNGGNFKLITADKIKKL